MYILIEQVAYEGSSFVGAYANLEDAMHASGEEARAFQSTKIDFRMRQPAGVTSLWTARSSDITDVTYLVWAVAV